jgi:predicted membrane channel-forming protein YqfA (hemolysin III family)
MSKGFIFWLIMLLWLLAMLGAYFNVTPWAGHAGNVVLFILLFLLGWHCFGFIINDSKGTP